jgi:Fe-S cluster assembly scaffold protein SufB
MVHLGKNSRSTIISKAISAGHGQNIQQPEQWIAS